MTEIDGYSTRVRLLDELLGRVDTETYPSATMLDMIESMLAPEDVPGYVETLVTKIHEDRFPSIPMLQRIARLAG